MSERGTKFNKGKVDLALLSPLALIEEAWTLSAGKVKYEAHNWRKGIPYSELLSALMRHLLLFLAGEDNDDESNTTHLANIRFCTGCLIEFHKIGRTDLDDRHKNPELVKAMKELMQSRDYSFLADKYREARKHLHSKRAPKTASRPVSRKDAQSVSRGNSRRVVQRPKGRPVGRV